MPSEGLTKALGQILKEYEEQGLTISGTSVYVNFYDEDGKAVDVVDAETGLSKEITLYAKDKFEDKILMMLNERMRNKDIAKELGITATRVSRVKKSLKERGYVFEKPKQHTKKSNKE